MPLSLYALAVATFAIGTTEFVVVGLIPGIAADLGVSIPTAGLLVSLIVSFVLITAAIHNEIAIFAVITIWGIFAFAIPPVMQTGVVATAEQVAPDALATASGFNIAAFNLGISSGSFIGSLLIKGPGLLATPYASIAMATVALLIAAFGLRPQSVSVDSKAA